MAKKSFAQVNKERVEKLIEQNPTAVRAVVARTIETRKIASKLPILDTIFNNARQQLGYGVSFEEFQKIMQEFQKVDEALVAIIDKATELGLYKPKKRKVKFKDVENKLKEMVFANKTDEEIAKELDIETQTVKAWIGLIKQKVEAEVSA